MKCVKMKNKTALQELLEWSRKEPLFYTNGTECISIEALFWKIQELLPKEKEQLKDAFFKGNAGAVKKDFNKYFENNYGE